jgi:hypothetical protein
MPSSIARATRTARSPSLSWASGPAEIGHDIIAEILGDMSAESSDCLGRDEIVASNHLTPFFGVEPHGDLG